MTLKDTLNSALQESMKSGDDIRRNTIRMTLAAIKQIEIDKRTSLGDEEIFSVIQKEIKSRRESISDALKANRPETITILENEISLLEGFLPKQMSKEELTVIIQKAIDELDAKSPSDMGKVMKIVLPQVHGQASGDAVSTIVRILLAQ
jgi:hypothetical protein